MRRAASTHRIRAAIGGSAALVGAIVVLLLAAGGAAPDRADAFFHDFIPCVPTPVTHCNDDDDIIPGDTGVPCVPGTPGCNRHDDIIPGDTGLPCVPTFLTPCEDTDDDIIPGEQGLPCNPLAPGCDADEDLIPGDPGGAVGDAISEQGTRIVEEALETIFGLEEGLTRELLQPFVTWLVEIPPLGESGAIAELGGTTTGIAFGLLAAVLTLAVIHYFLSGLSLMSNSGGDAPVEALYRTVAAALFILAWKWAFVRGVDLANATSALIISTTELERIIHPLGYVIPIGDLRMGFGGFIVGIIVRIAGILLFLAVLVFKVAYTAAMAVLFVAMPFALALWALPSTKWIATYALKAVTAIALVPVIWAICLAVLGAMFDELTSGDTGVADQIVNALGALAMLVLMLSLSKAPLRAAGVGGGGAGVLGHLASFTFGHFMHSALSQVVPDSLGGRATSIKEQQTRQALQDSRQQWWDQHRLDQEKEVKAHRDRLDTERADGKKANEQERAWRHHQDPYQAERDAHSRMINDANRRAERRNAAREAQEVDRGWDEHKQGRPEDVAADLRAYRESTGQTEPFATEVAPGRGGSAGPRAGATDEGYWTQDGTFVSMRDGLPTHPGDDRFAGAAGEVAVLKDSLEQGSDDPRSLMQSQGRAALGAIAEDAPEYLGPTLGALQNQGGDPSGAYTTARLADAYSADGLSPSVRDAFGTLAAVDEDIRPGLAADFRRESDPESSSES